MRYFITILSAALILGGTTIAAAQTWKLVSPGGSGSGSGISCPPPWGADTPSSFIPHGEYVEAYKGATSMSCQKSWRACSNGALLGDEAYRFETCEDAQFITATRSGYADIVLVKVGQTTTIRGVKDFSDACRSLGFDRPGTSEGNSSCSLFYGAPLTGNQCNQGGHWQHYTLSQNFSGGIVLYMNLPTPADVTSGGTSGLYRYNMPARNAGQTLANDYNSCCGGSGATTSANLLAGDYLVCAVP